MDQGEKQREFTSVKHDEAITCVLPHLKTAAAWYWALAVRIGVFRYKMLCANGILSKNVSILFVFTWWHCSLLCETIKKGEKTLPASISQMPNGSLDLSVTVGVHLYHGESQWPETTRMLVEINIPLFPVFQQSEYVHRTGSHVIYFHSARRNEMLHQVLPIWSVKGEKFVLLTAIFHRCPVSQTDFWPILFLESVCYAT